MLNRLWMVLCVILAGSVMAQTHPASRPTSAPTTAPAIVEGVSESTHELKLAEGEVLKYRAKAGTLPYAPEEAAKPTGNLFYVAYDKLPVDSNRPITFIFNGGPGAAAVWLHIGTAGPKILFLGDQLQPPASPGRLIDNPDTWLKSSDLVFIDPIGTGYSRLVEGEKSRDVFSTEGDIKSMANFIRLYLTRNQRWLSPKFLAGESYGTTRAAGLADYLHERYGIDLRGIVLISSVLDFATLSPGEGNDLPYALYLPSYAAVAHYHGKTGQQPIEQVIKDAQQYALNDYTKALLQGGSLSDEQRHAVAEKLSQFMGLSVDYILKNDLRIDPERFEKQLLNDKRQVVGRFDARITGHDDDPAGSRPQLDPSLDFYIGLYNSTINDYVRTTLGYQSDLPYEVLTGRVHPWDFGKEMGYLNMSSRLRDAMIKNPHLRVLVSSGYYDLATPFLATTYTLNRLAMTPELRERIEENFYPAGHMIYHNTNTRPELNEKINGFLSAP